MPSYDPAGITSLLAANLVYEFIALTALRRRDEKAGSAASEAASDADLPQGMERGVIGLGIGHPSPLLLPTREMRAATLALDDELLQEPVAAGPALQYGPEAGSLALLEQLRPQLERWEGLDIPGGAADDHRRRHAGGPVGRHALRQCRNSGVLVESPSYRDALHIFRDLERPLHPIPMTGGRH